MIWTPRVTVAAIVKQNNRFLVVEERENGRTVFNQPAGHLEEDETLVEAVIRETREETGLLFEPKSLVGVYQWKHPVNHLTFVRFCFAGETREQQLQQSLDPDIIAVHWMTLSELEDAALRSPLVIECITDYLSGKSFEINLLKTTIS